MKKIILGSLLVASSLFASDVIAIVNGTKITKTEINNILKSRGATYDRLSPQQKKMVLDEVIAQALVIQKAQNSGVENTPEYKAMLKKVKAQIAAQVFLEQKLKSMKVSDAEIKAFYEKNKDRIFKQPAMLKARHIVVKTKAEAEKIINELKNTPKNKLEQKFIELAKKYSTGPSAKNGGELGWFNVKQMVPSFSQAALNLKPGQFTTTPVQTQFGWHVIYLQDKKSSSYIPFNVVKAKIKAYLQQQKLKQYIIDLKNKAKIEYK